MFRPKLFGAHIEPACEYCRHGTGIRDNQMILCEKQGVVAPYYSCRKFVYDPLKRVPRSTPKLQQFDESDFTL